MMLTLQENKELLSLMAWAKYFMDVRKLPFLEDEIAYLENVLTAYPQKYSDQFIKLKPLMEKSLDELKQKQHYFQTHKAHKYTKVFSEKKKRGNSAIINWLIFELSNILKKENQKTDWDKVLKVLLEHDLSKMCLRDFSIEGELAYGASRQGNVENIRNRRYKWIELCEKKGLSPAVHTEYQIIF